MKRRRSIKVYVCGTIPWELDPGNSGRIEFYMSPTALSDELPCADYCGILQATIEIGRFVQPRHVRAKGLSPEKYLAEEKEMIRIADTMMAAVSSEQRERVLSAATWVLAGLQMARTKRRRAKRLRLAAKNQPGSP